MTYDQLTDMLHWLEGGMIDTAIAEVKSELAKPEPIYIMGNYAGEGKVVSASFGLPKGAFEFAPYAGKGEASKIKHSLEPMPGQEPVCDKDPSLCGFTLCQLAKQCAKQKWSG